MITAIARFDTSRGWAAPLPQLDSEQTLVLVFGDRTCIDHPDGIAQLLRAFPRSQVLGCSTSGQIVGDSVQDGGLDALIMKFESATLRVASVPIEDGSDSRALGESLGSKLTANDLKGVFVLSDGTLVNGTQLCAGLTKSLPANTPTTGGLAGDGDHFEHTWVCCNSLPKRGMIAAVGVYGEAAEILHGCKGGWDAFGPERAVTASAGNVLYELDNAPALGVYETYLGEQAAQLPASALLFPLLLRRPGEKTTVVRTILGMSRENGTMTFAGDIPEGSTVQLMRANFDRLISGAADAAAMIPLTRDAHTTAACVPISCVGRRLILKHRCEEELEEVAGVLPPGTPNVGFYSYGEISPHVGAACELHNQTMTLTVFVEHIRSPGAQNTRKAAA